MPYLDKVENDEKKTEWKLYYELYGSNDAPHKVLFVMGYQASHLSWHLQKAYFAKKPELYQCAYYDNRGFAWSGVPPPPYTTQMLALDGISLADHLGWDKFHVVGASMGGMIAQHIGLLAPTRVQSLTLLVTRCQSQGWFGWLPPWKGALGFLKISWYEGYPELQASYGLEILFSTKFLNKEINEEVEISDDEKEKDQQTDGQVENVQVVARKKTKVYKTNRDKFYDYFYKRKLLIPTPNQNGVYGQTTAVRGHHLTDQEVETLRSAPFSILVVGATEDVLMDVSHCRVLRDLLNAEYEEYEAGHAVAEECAEVLNQRLEKFWNKAEQKVEEKSNSPPEATTTA